MTGFLASRQTREARDRLCPEHQADDGALSAALSRHRSPWADGPARDQPDDRHDQAGGDAP